MEHRSEPFTSLFIEDLMSGMWARRLGMQGCQPSLMKIGNRVANRLIATANETGNGGR
jgi:hypothetical protein